MNRTVAVHQVGLAGVFAPDIDWPGTLILLAVLGLVLLVVGALAAIVLAPRLRDRKGRTPPPERAELDWLASALRVSPGEVPGQVAALIDRLNAADHEVDRLRREVDRLQQQGRGGGGNADVTAALESQRQALISGCMKVVGLLDDDIVTDALDEALRRAGVTIFDATGMALDPTRHRVDHTLAAPNPDSDGIVAETLTAGYIDNNRVLRPADVAVYKWSG